MVPSLTGLDHKVSGWIGHQICGWIVFFKFIAGLAVICLLGVD